MGRWVGQYRAAALVAAPLLAFALLTACSGGLNHGAAAAPPLCSAAQVAGSGEHATVSMRGVAGCAGTLDRGRFGCQQIIQPRWDGTYIGPVEVATNPSGLDTAGTGTSGTGAAGTGAVSTGAPPFSFTVPASAVPGHHMLVVNCNQAAESGYSLTVDFVVVVPALSADPAQAMPGDRITLTVTDLNCLTRLAKDNIVVVRWNGLPTAPNDHFVIATPYAPASVDIQVPKDATEGHAKVTVACRWDSAGVARATTTIDVTTPPAAQPMLTVGRAKGGVPTPITVRGVACASPAGYQAGVVYLGKEPTKGADIGQTNDPLASPDQAYGGVITMPDTAEPGQTYPIVLVCPASGPAVAGTVTMANVTPTLAAKPVRGKPGSAVALTVSGISCAGADTVSAAVARWDDPAGTEIGRSTPDAPVLSWWHPYTIAVTVPADATKGNHTIAVACDTGGPTVSVGFGVALPPATVTPATVSVLAGSAVTVTVSNINCADQGGTLSVLFDSQPIATVAWTDPAALPLTVGVPDDAPAGIHSVGLVCSGAPSGGAVAAQVRTFVPGFTLGSGEGIAGAHLTLKGSGFNCANQAVSIRWDGTTAMKMAGAAGVVRDGAFTAAIVAPASAAPGAHAVAVTCKGSVTPVDQPFTVQAPRLTVNPRTAGTAAHVTVAVAYLPESCATPALTIGSRTLPTTQTATHVDPATGRTIDLDATIPEDARGGRTTIALRCVDPQSPAAAQAAFTVAQKKSGIDLTPILGGLLALALVVAGTVIARVRRRGPGRRGRGGPDRPEPVDAEPVDVELVVKSVSIRAGRG
jgi:hypothetical protein